MFTHIAYSTTITKGGKLDGIQVRPADSKKYGVLFATTKEEQQKIESWPAFKEGRIKRMAEETDRLDINDVLGHESVNPSGGRPHRLISAFTANELKFCSGLTDAAYKSIKEEAIKIAESDKGMKYDPSGAEESPKGKGKSAGGKKKAAGKDVKAPENKKAGSGVNAGKPNARAEALKDRLRELEIPFGGNPSIKVLEDLLRAQSPKDPLLPPVTQADMEKEAKELADKSRAGE